MRMSDMRDEHTVLLLSVVIGSIVFFVLGFTQGWFNIPEFSVEIIDRSETWNSSGTPQYFITIQMPEEKRDVKITVDAFFSKKFAIGQVFTQPDSYNWGVITLLVMLASSIYILLFFAGYQIWPKQYIRGVTHVQYGDEIQNGDND